MVRIQSLRVYHPPSNGTSTVLFSTPGELRWPISDPLFFWTYSGDSRLVDNGGEERNVPANTIRPGARTTKTRSCRTWRPSHRTSYTFPPRTTTATSWGSTWGSRWGCSCSCTYRGTSSTRRRRESSWVSPQGERRGGVRSRPHCVRRSCISYHNRFHVRRYFREGFETYGEPGGSGGDPFLDNSY